MSVIKIYWEDFAAGQVRELGSITPCHSKPL